MNVMTATPQQVQKLREKTGAGFMDCKKALESSNGDLDKAIQFLREKGKMSAAQKAGRSAKQGLVCCWVREDGKMGGLVEINCETDFVAKTAEFIDLAKKISKQAGENSIQSVENLLSQKLAGSADTVDSVLKEKIGQLGENMMIKKVAAFGKGDTFVGSYLHAALEKAPECGTLGVLIEAKSDKDHSELKALLRELSMQVAAASPKWIKKEDVPSDLVQKEIAIYKEQCKQSGKPEKAWDKIVESKLADFYKQTCLLEQAYIRDAKTNVQSCINSVSQKNGFSITVLNFARFKVGEE